MSNSKGMGDIRLSHSSGTLLLGCEERYWHYKVNKTQHDSDYNDNQEHFAIGKSFHHVLETTLHRHPKHVGMSMSKLLEDCVQEHGLAEDKQGLVHAMVLAYLREFSATDLEVVAVEFSIDDPNVVGYIDAIVKDKKGNWWILDLKTSKSIMRGTQARLYRNRQLNLYAYYKDDFAERFDLNAKKFKGCIYWTTTKSTARQFKKTYKAYVEKMLETIVSVPYYIEAKRMDPKGAYETHMELYNRSVELRSGEAPKRNYEYCYAFFSPCPWFSNCNGGCFSDLNGEE